MKGTSRDPVLDQLGSAARQPLRRDVEDAFAPACLSRAQ